jgi:hypothetical protein
MLTQDNRSSLGGTVYLRSRHWVKLITYVGHTVTVFGATGFLGRYIVNRLGMDSNYFPEGKVHMRKRIF